MEISEKYNIFFVCVDRNEKEFISEDAPKKVEDYINDNLQNKTRYKEFLTKWQEGLYGDYYSYIDYSDYGVFYGEDLEYDWLLELPNGTIENACGKKLTYEDGVKEVRIRPVSPVGIKFEIVSKDE